MADFDDLTEQCPLCDGAGCEICQQSGRLMVSSKVQAYVSDLQHQLHDMRTTRRNMLDTYIRWVDSDDDKRALIMKLIKASVYKQLPDEGVQGMREFDRIMSQDFVELETRIQKLREIIGHGEKVVSTSRDLWRAAKRKRAEQSAPPKPPPPKPLEVKHTKAAGKVCSFPNCKKDTYVTDEKGRGWCKKHGYARGLLERPKIQEEEEDGD